MTLALRGRAALFAFLILAALSAPEAQTRAPQTRPMTPDIPPTFTPPTTAFDYVKREATRPDQQQAVLDALIFKCDVLWAQLDALYAAYVEPGMVPPGAFRPEAL